MKYKISSFKFYVKVVNECDFNRFYLDGVCPTLDYHIETKLWNPLQCLSDLEDEI